MSEVQQTIGFGVPYDHVTLDIETLPTDDPIAIDELSKRIQPPGNMKKPETIAEWERTEKPFLLEDAVKKTSYDGTYGRICCVSWAFGQDDSHAAIGEEKDVISTFFAAISAFGRGPTLSNSPVATIGHNIYSFDLKFLWKRAVILSIPRPFGMPWHESQYSPRIQDTMLMWDRDQTKRISLDRLCRVLGVKHKVDSFDGSKVAAAWRRGQKRLIAAYCCGDVDATRDCWLRLRD